MHVRPLKFNFKMTDLIITASSRNLVASVQAFILSFFLLTLSSCRQSQASNPSGREISSLGDNESSDNGEATEPLYFLYSQGAEAGVSLSLGGKVPELGLPNKPLVDSPMSSPRTDVRDVNAPHLRDVAGMRNSDFAPNLDSPVSVRGVNSVSSLPGSRTVSPSVSPAVTPRTGINILEQNKAFIANAEARPDIVSDLNEILVLDGRAVIGDNPAYYKQMQTADVRVVRFDKETGKLAVLPGAALRRPNANAVSEVIPDAFGENSYSFVSYANSKGQFITVGNKTGKHTTVSGLYKVAGFEDFKPVLSGEYRVQNNVIISVNNKSGHTNRYDSMKDASADTIAAMQRLEQEALSKVFHVAPEVVTTRLEASPPVIAP